MLWAKTLAILPVSGSFGFTAPIRLGSSIIPDGRKYGARQEQGHEQAMQPSTVFFFHGIANTAVDALAEVGRNRFLAKSAAG